MIPQTNQIWVWNTRSVAAQTSQARVELSLALHRHKPLAAAICETRLTPSRRWRELGYSIDRLDHKKTASGVAILVRTDVKSAPLTHLAVDISHGPTAALALPIRIVVPTAHTPRSLVVVVCYIPPNLPAAVKTTFATRLDALLRHPEIVHHPVLLTGDLNCRDVKMAGSVDTPADSPLFAPDPRHPAVLVADSNDLFSLNSIYAPNTPTRTPTNGTASCLTVALTTHPQLFTNLRIGHAALKASDHMPIALSLAHDVPLTQPTRRTRTRFADLPQPTIRKFQTLCDSAHFEPPPHVPAANRCNHTWNALRTAMATALIAITPPQPTHPNKPPLPLALQRQYRTLRHLQNRRVKLKHRNPFDAAQYQAAASDAARAKREFGAALRLHRTQMYIARTDRLFDAATKSTRPKWRELRAILSTPPPRPGLIAGPAIPSPATDSDSATNFANHLRQTVTSAPPLAVDDPILPPHTAITPFSRHEFDEALKKLPQDKAPGEDGFTGAAIRNAGARWLDGLFLLTNLSLSTATIPSDWCSSKSFVLHKTGPTSDPANYRVITLEATALKLVERMVLQRMFAPAEPALNPLQFGFRPGRSTQDAITYLLAKTARARRLCPLSFPVAFLDLKAAFDRVPHRTLFTALAHPRYRIHPQLVRWCAAFCRDRDLTVEVGDGRANPLRTTTGVPQGSVISPFLFLIFADTLYHDLSASPPPDARAAIPPPLKPGDSFGCDLLSFADDIALIPRRTGISAALDLQHALGVAAEWAANRNMSFGHGVKKSAVVYFQPFSKPHEGLKPAEAALKEVRLAIGQQQLPTAQNYKYLGAVLSEDHSAAAHYKHLKTQIDAAANGLLPLVRPKSTFPVFLLTNLIRSHVLSVFDYSAPFFSFTREQLGSLASAIIRPFRRAVRQPFCSHKTSLFHEAAILPPDLAQLLARDRLIARHHSPKRPNCPASTALRQELADGEHAGKRPKAMTDIAERWASWTGPQPPTSDAYYNLLHRRLLGDAIPTNSHLSTKEKGWGFPLRAIQTAVLPPLDIPQPSLFRFRHKPAYLSLPPDEAALVASARLDRLSTWRAAKQNHTEPPACTHCGPGTTNTARHILLICPATDHIRQRLLTPLSPPVRNAVHSLTSSFDPLSLSDQLHAASVTAQLVRLTFPLVARK